LAKGIQTLDILSNSDYPEKEKAQEFVNEEKVTP
jgi:hypothetical protein